ncbi:hypothetical protein ACJIZ3_002157 [Penstemon smallii]|uniref:Transmembrane protein n=1 Tax=Penstemon smallii TaxID=265156 RepID=A0ABD3U5M7_9LAMI
MDREQEEIQFLGFFGILKESHNIISSWRKIFTQITLSLIIPLSFIYLGTRYYNKISNILSSELTSYILFKIGYLIFFIILALLSTSAVVYTIACIYTAKGLTFKKVMSVVPKVWKRLMVTFIWSFVIIFVYNFVSFFILFLGLLLLGNVVGIVFGVLFTIIYLTGIVYVTMIWHLASVVSVLEESYGLNAMSKSQILIKGKMGVSIAVFVLLGLCLIGIQIMFEHFVVDGDVLGKRIGFGIICLILLSILMVFGLVAQTVIYFVCKSYHHENIDKSSLSDHLGGYLGEYVPLKTKDVQLEHFQV